MTIPVVLRNLAFWGMGFAYAAAAVSAAPTPETIAGPFVYPESVCYGPDGTLYVTEIGVDGKAGDGKVTALKDGKTRTLADGLDDPKGIVFYKEALYTTDLTKVVKIDLQGRKSDYAKPEMFPTKPLFLNDIAVDAGHGIFLVTDSGDRKGKGGACYRIDVRLNKIDTLADTTTIPDLKIPNGVAFDGESHLILADFGAGVLYRVKFDDRSAKPIADGMPGADGLVWDHFGRLFITSWLTGKVFAIPQPGRKPILIGEGLKSAADACLSSDGKKLLVPDMKGGTLTSISTAIPGWEVEDAPLPLETKVAFPKLKWTGWDDGRDAGKPNEFRPIVLTHAGDGSKRIFVATQQGVVHAIEGGADAAATKVFLDLSDRVRYSDRQNEEGFLGLAFHPKFKENGEFFVFYTDVKAKMANVLSRFRVKKGDPTVGDPASEEELIRFEKPFWNHDGGSIAFGPDGFLYVSHGDGGDGGDPHENGQSLKTLLGKILRIDVDRKAGGKNYAIPADNPFVAVEGARPEIFAYGLRNVWRMSFDRKTGRLWGGEVGQNVFEEIILVKSGGNYGWNLREAFHPFGRKGVDVQKELIEPIWEYHHEIGRSITGGYVYRGSRIPELAGSYVYSDYVSGRLWALTYDESKGRVVANRPIVCPNLQALSYGEDADGELYLLRADRDGKAIFRFEKAAPPASASR